MASQQVLFAETIAGMKKAFKRRAWESDSDSEIEQYGNRGNKLKRRARFTNQGQLVPNEGPSGYKETVDYAGVRRSIINRNPRLVDDDGYGVDSDDDDRVEDAISAAADQNPYSNIRLENILAPLTASTDLPSHPTLSKPFTSPNLTNLVEQSSAMTRQENSSLWRVRHLFTSLCGDHVWAPCESMIGPDDAKLYTDDHVAMHLLSLSKGISHTAHDANATNVGAEQAAGTSTAAAEDADVSMADSTTNNDETKVTNTHTKTETKEATTEERSEANVDHEAKQAQDPVGNDQIMTNGDASHGIETSAAQGPNNRQPVEESSALDQTEGAPAGPDAAAQSFVHPIFLPPGGARPDRDLGVPENEAEDLRRMLNAFVQKQEEVARGSQRLHDGLNRAERLRKDVLHWSKAEAHCGPNRDMSDGEDWYDKEEWGLTEDLKKGQDDEEEDTTTTAKKTRARR